MDALSPLTPIGNDIWFADGEIVRFLGMSFPTRCIIVRLTNDKLWVWSPVLLSPELEASVRELGEVSFLVSPNPLHHLYLSDWADAFPGAAICGPSMTAKKRTDLGFTHLLGKNAPEIWRDEIDQVHLTGSPYFEEIVFFHHKSDSLMFADMVTNLPRRFLARYWPGWRTPFAQILGVTSSRPSAPLETRLGFIRHNELRVAVAKMIEWKPSQILVAHGNHMHGNCVQQIKQSFSWVRGV